MTRFRGLRCPFDPAADNPATRNAGTSCLRHKTSKCRNRRRPQFRLLDVGVLGLFCVRSAKVEAGAPERPRRVFFRKRVRCVVAQRRFTRNNRLS